MLQYSTGTDPLTRYLCANHNANLNCAFACTMTEHCAGRKVINEAAPHMIVGLRALSWGTPVWVCSTLQHNGGKQAEYFTPIVNFVLLCSSTPGSWGHPWTITNVQLNSSMRMVRCQGHKSTLLYVPFTVTTQLEIKKIKITPSVGIWITHHSNPRHPFCF